MKSSASKIKMTSFDDLFGDNEETTSIEDTANRIQHIEISRLLPFAHHPFKVLDDGKMEETKESIAKYGVLVPIIARPKADGTFEIIAGHRRKRACELLEIKTIPTMVRDLDDEESTIIMVDSNIQRENLLFSEKAFAYKMKLDAIKSQGKRNDLTLAQVVPKLSAREKVAQDAGVNRMEVTRYIRLTELIAALLDMTDERKIAFNTAVEISYLTQEEQEILQSKIEELMIIPSMAQATKLKKYSSEGTINETVIDAILSETADKPVTVTLKSEKLTKYFPKNYSKEQIEDVITTLLEKWHSEYK
ncbi:ParB/RepB/Spo0J family partition protein [Anaerotignum propionicum]|uniref:Chromosome partitioning protein, ParB family n=1 Tax=Anaerotignum propionicum DSM 1682 TaxID=991789 RepID=A0A0X1U958_ANAPI|nr:ParB/RepB/Spo0J family partition protein [Anaerotignum propionicum]AMJ41477.1 putative chromosome-partitioning protein ParB [Anaerotignum propionicum DSM 1682]SHE69458.1 chromosome partitioning protein, ParB family [[Clostridium] propionicum DSM 1682] [Anaerotignum propionicum DSM 1682]